MYWLGAESAAINDHFIDNCIDCLGVNYSGHAARKSSFATRTAKPKKTKQGNRETFLYNVSAYFLR